MAAIHETAYPRIKPGLTFKEIKEIFTPTNAEVTFMQVKTKMATSQSQLGFILLLKCYQYLGRPIKINSLSETIKYYVADKLSIDTSLTLNAYDESTRKHHIKAVREYLQINDDKKKCRQHMKETALKAATTKENIADIINVMIEEAIKERFELVPFNALHRIAMAARKVANYKSYQKHKRRDFLSGRT